MGSQWEDRPLGWSPGPSWSGARGPSLRCRAYDSNSGCSLAASGLGSGPGCSLSCTSSSGWTASQQGGGEEHSVTLHCSRNSNQTGGGPTHVPLAAQPAGPGVAGAPAHRSPASFPPPLARDKDPGLSVCPTGIWKGGGARTGASSRLCRPSWTGNTPIGLGCQLPVPGLGNELLAAPHDSSPGRLRPRPAGPHPAQHLRLPGSTCDPAGEHASPSRSGPVLQARLRAQAAPAPLSWGGSAPGTSPISLWDTRAGPHPYCTGQGSQWLLEAAATVPPDEPTPPPPQSGCSCQDRRLELQVRWPAATARLSAREEAGPPLESFTRSSFPLHLSPGSAGSAALAPLALPRPLSDYNAALFAAPLHEAPACLGGLGLPALSPPAPPRCLISGPSSPAAGNPQRLQHESWSLDPGAEKARSCPKSNAGRGDPAAAGGRQGLLMVRQT